MQNRGSDGLVSHRQTVGVGLEHWWITPGVRTEEARRKNTADVLGDGWTVADE